MKEEISNRSRENFLPARESDANKLIALQAINRLVADTRLLFFFKLKYLPIHKDENLLFSLTSGLDYQVFFFCFYLLMRFDASLCH